MALFEALYREYLVPLKKYAYRIGVGYDDIEDMVHEAFIEYYKRYSLDLDHKVKLVLLIRILRSKWIDNRRQMRAPRDAASGRSGCGRRDYEPSFGRGDRNSASGSGGYR
ncbi:MAG: sigma-70 family RNA polymerase sigma factor [Clostridium fessum]